MNIKIGGNKDSGVAPPPPSNWSFWCLDEWEILRPEHGFSSK